MQFVPLLTQPGHVRRVGAPVYLEPLALDGVDDVHRRSAVVTDAGDQARVSRSLVGLDRGPGPLLVAVEPQRRRAVEVDGDLVAGVVELAGVGQRVRELAGIFRVREQQEGVFRYFPNESRGCCLNATK